MVGKRIFIRSKRNGYGKESSQEVRQEDGYEKRRKENDYEKNG
jgi:hypothetical protein